MPFEIEARCPTYRAEVHVGLTEGCGGTAVGAERLCVVLRDFADANSVGLSLAYGMLIYPAVPDLHGEPAATIGLVANPRYPKAHGEVKRLAIELAASLAGRLNQERVYVVADDETLVIRPAA